MSWHKEPTNYEIARTLINMAGEFGHHSYFRDKLWKGCNGYEDADEAEILAYFMISRCYINGMYLAPLGCMFASPSSKESTESYLKSKRNLADHYNQWFESQR